MWKVAQLIKATVSGRFYFGISTWSVNTLTLEDGSTVPMLSPNDSEPLPEGSKKSSFVDDDTINSYESVEELIKAYPSFPTEVELNTETGETRLIEA